MAADFQARRDFIKANTALLAPPHVPEVRLYLADEAHELWQKTEAELQSIGLPPPFWAFAWAGGQAIARYVLDNPGLVENRRVLDFATGSGLVAIAAAKAGAAIVTATDIDPFTPDAVALNSRANAVEIHFSPQNYIGSKLETDLLLAGDVFFDRDFADQLIPWFDAVADDGITILIGDPGRAYLPKGRLARLAEYEVPVTRELEDAEVKRTVVWQWKKPAVRS